MVLRRAGCKIDGGQEPLLPVIARRFVALAGGPEANIILVPTAMNNNGKKFTEEGDL